MEDYDVVAVQTTKSGEDGQQCSSNNKSGEDGQ